MTFKRGDIVTRKSYNHDTAFKIINIKNDIYYLKGLEVRLYADATGEDLEIYTPIAATPEETNEYDRGFPKSNNDYFYLPAKILHLDGDKDYLDRCLKFYQQKGIFAIGKKLVEEHIYENILPLLKEYKPDIVIITGHDAYYSKKGDINDLNNYRNTKNFINAVKVARKYEKDHEKLVIIAGACQSNYEELIKAGANFASSPKRINIHALDPAIIAATLALTEKNKEIDLLELLDKTKYGHDGMGGLKSNGLMYVGYPR
ncbi:MAG: sporulation peptidase YabG [Bacilli bacterium]|nr:sporulation peptidase YabG [Bacilli bacterium]